MQRLFSLGTVIWLPAVVAACALGVGECQAQTLRGGELVIKAQATGEERTAQSDLFVMDVVYKPMRMIPVELTDPATGEKKLEYVWYIVYRVFNRKLVRPTSDTPPQNVVDPTMFAQSVNEKGKVVPVAPLSAYEDFRWQPEKSAFGPVTVLISTRNQTVIALRNGIEIGRSKSA